MAGRIRSRRVVICIIAASALVMSLFAALVGGQVALPGKAPRTATSMAALAPQLLAKPGADPATGAAPQPACREAMLPANDAALAAPGRSALVSHDGATVAVTGKAVSKPVRITAQSLCATSMAKLDQGMNNVTAGPRRGYRFLPHMNFGTTLRITLPYDPALIPVGMSASDIRTFYYDVNAKKWEALPLVKVDTKARTVTSTTTHFTDFTVSTITTPDAGAPINDDPTTIKDIKAADPGANVNLISAPEPASDGAAHLTYPIQLPAGRHGQLPTVAVSYNSSNSGADGWMGLGWDLPTSAITVDTQFGVPHYDPKNETETYMVDGGELTPVANRGTPVPRTADKTFHSRVEGTFLQIVRHGSDPKSYWWEVTGKDGTKFFYGGDPENGLDPGSVLTDGQGNVFQWGLKESEDLDGNTVHYSYAHVSDPGIAGGTVNGTNMYPASINYTGTGDAAGPYTVTFVRDRQLPGYTRRPDVTTSALGGFLMVTADLLKEIDVSFNGQPVRSYQMDYTTGAFGKTLLSSITQLGADGTVFNTHSFSYYNDAQDSSGDYTGFSPATTVDTGNDNVTAGLLGQGQASALSGSETTTADGSLYAGFNPAAPDKEGSVGAKVGFSTGNTDGVLAMIDLNGDGKPDKVFEKDGAAYLRVNTTVPGGQVAFSATASPLPTLPALSHSSSQVFSAGAEAYLGANVFTNVSQTVTTTDTYFQDVNDDGLADLVDNGQVLFNHLNGDGIPTFTANSADTPVPIVTGTVDTSGVSTPAVSQQASADDPLVDTLRVWTAPYTGTVAISGDVSLAQAAGAQSVQADGVRVAIQRDGTELWNDVIPPGDHSPHVPTGVDALPVTAGDRIYFRVQSGNEGTGDQVSWDPVISYQGVTSATDVNGLDVYTYQASKDFTLAGRPGAVIQAPLDGTLEVSGAFHKAAPTTDDVTVEVVRNGTAVFSKTMAAADTGDIPVDVPIQVAKGDTLALREKIDSPIDVTQLSWAPQVYYTSSPSATVTDASGNPLVQLSPPVDTDLYPADDQNGAVQQAWTAPSDGTVTVSPRLTVASGASGTLTFTVKKQGALVRKEPITISGGNDSDPSFSLAVSAGDQLYFDYSVADAALASQISGESVQVGYDGQDPVTVPSALHRATAPAIMSESYRGWSYVAYNGDGARATQPVDESALTASLTTSSSYDPTTAKAYPMYPAPADGQWTGPNSSVYVRAGSISSSRLGAPSLTVSSAADFAGASAPATVSDSQQTAVGGGVSLLSGSADSGSTSSDVDYIDMNGSGYPAVVSNGHVQYPDQTGALQPDSVAVPGLGTARSSNATSVNAGIGGNAATFKANSEGKVDNPGQAPTNNAAGSQDVSLGLSGTLGSGESHPRNDLVDMNGDGLPDIVTRNGGQLMVSLNLGYSFAPAEPWGTGQLGDGASGNGTIGATLGFNDGIYGYAGGVSLSKDESETSEQLISMNGDGLPDRVINTSSGLQVAFNTGAGFAPPVPFPGVPNGACTDNVAAALAGIDWSTTRLCNGTTSQGAGLYFTVGIGPLCLAGCYVILNPGADASQSMSREEGALEDVTGSGDPDYVSSTSDGSLTVSLNNIGRTNILKSVSRPLGATITLDYQRAGGTYQLPQQRWVMSHVTVDPGVAGEPIVKTAYTYSGGVYDRLERTFYGFGTVTENDLDTAKGDAIYRSTVRTYDTSSYYTHGLVLDTRAYDASGHLYTDDKETYDTRNVLTGADPADVTSTTATIFPMLVRTDTSYYEGGTTAQKSTFTTQRFDSFGNVVQQFAAGDPGTGDDVTTTTSYASCPGTYLMAAPASVVQTDANGNMLAHREQTVDCATGNVLEVRKYLADGGSADTDSTYLPDGMVASVTAPPNQAGQRYKVSYTYDDTTGTYVTSTTDIFGLTSTATQDLRFGTPLTVTDENGNTTSYAYDEFGRTTSVTGPFQQGSGIPTITFQYHPDAVMPWAITHNADVYNGPGASIDTVTFADGLDRVIQTKKSATVFTGAGSAPQNVMQVSGHVTFDPFGRTIATYYPVTEPLGTPGVYNTSVDPVAPTTTTYDVLDRITATTVPDGSTTTTAYGFGTDRSGATQFMTTLTDGNGHVKITYHDARNLLTGQEEFHAGAPIWTSYAYDPLDRETSVTDDQGKVTTTSYDLLGEITDVTSPDEGHTQTVYDLAGDKVAEITPNLRAKSEQVSYGYDYNRLVSISYPDNPSEDVTYAYGARGATGNGAGRVIQTTDVTGTTKDSYDALGNVTYEARTVNTTIGMLQPTYVSQYTYDTFGRVQSMVYPDGEVLTYHYDSGGFVDKVTGTKGPNSYTYVSSLQYDKFGAKAYIDYGNGVTSKFSYDPRTRRLATQESAPSGGSDFQDISYTYDPVGNLTALANTVAVSPNGGFGGPTTQQFSYDDLDRLTSASGTYDFAPKKENDYSLSMTYNSVSDILEKNQANWTIGPSGKGMVGKNTYDSTYAYGAAQENAPSHVGSTAYTYDADGNLTGTAADSSGQQMTLTYNDANQLTSLANNGMTTTYVYDASGNRAMKRVSNGEIVYVNQFFTIRNGEIGTKQIIVANTLIAEQMVDHDDTVYEADQWFFQGDQIGSANYVTDASGNVFEHNEYLPTGEVWDQDATDTHNIPFGFAGAETDPESGFSYLGARYYNPVTGTFTSPDPALAGNVAAVGSTSAPNTFAPSFLNAYNYCDDDPLTKTDPTGDAPTFSLPTGLTTMRLRQIAINAGIVDPNASDLNTKVGRAFQVFANRQLGLTENLQNFESPLRASLTETRMFMPLGPTGVVPDAVNAQNATTFTLVDGFLPDMTTETFLQTAFFDVKAVAGSLTPGYDQFQLLGMLDVLSRSPSAVPMKDFGLSPSLTIISTSNTKVSPSLINAATELGIALYQVKAYVIDSPAGPLIGFYPAVALNELAKQGINANLQFRYSQLAFGALPAPLTGGFGPGDPRNPDPVTLRTP